MDILHEKRIAGYGFVETNNQMPSKLLTYNWTIELVNGETYSGRIIYYSNYHSSIDWDGDKKPENTQYYEVMIDSLGFLQMPTSLQNKQTSK